MREFPGKGRKHLDWITLSRSCLKGDAQAQPWSCMLWTVPKPTSDATSIRFKAQCAGEWWIF